MRSVALKWLMACFVAIGLIAQAAAAVRHHGAMIERAVGAADATGSGLSSAMRALEADLRHAICQPGEARPGDETGSRPSQHGDDCPICNGLACAFALAPPSGLVVPATLAEAPKFWPPSDQRVTHLRLIRPPSRGPPAFV